MLYLIGSNPGLLYKTRKGRIPPAGVFVHIPLKFKPKMHPFAARLSALALVAIAIAAIIPAAACAVETSSYTLLAAEKRAKEAERQAAADSGDAEALIRATRELDAINAQLAGDEMRFLRSYAETERMLSEAQYLIGRSEVSLGTAPGRGEYDRISRVLSQSEAPYDSQDYKQGIPALEGARSAAAGLPASIASECSALASSAKGSAAPSGASMLAAAAKKFEAASSAYSSAGDRLLSASLFDAGAPLDEARAVADEAFALASKSKSQPPGPDMLGIAIVAGPAAVALLLALTFRKRSARAAVACALSKSTALAGVESFVERMITVTNIEKYPIAMTVFDAPPHALAPTGFNPEPAAASRDGIVWQFDLAPGKRRDISYKLRVPRLEAGWMLRIPATAVAYAGPGGQKKSIAKPDSIKIV